MLRGAYHSSKLLNQKSASRPEAKHCTCCTPACADHYCHPSWYLRSHQFRVIVTSIFCCHTLHTNGTFCCCAYIHVSHHHCSLSFLVSQDTTYKLQQITTLQLLSLPSTIVTCGVAASGCEKIPAAALHQELCAPSSTIQLVLLQYISIASVSWQVQVMSWSIYDRCWNWGTTYLRPEWWWMWS